MSLLRFGLLLSVAVAGPLATASEARAQAAGAVAVPAKSYGPSFSLPAPQPGQPDATAGPGVSEYDLSLGCIVGGLTGTGLSVSAGGMNVVNLIAGGLVPAATPVAMWVALGGVVFASFCSVGQALTPTAMATYAYFVPPAPAPNDPRSLDARYCLAAQPLAGPSAGERLLAVRALPERM